jgi:hypothetical protein
MSENGCFPTFFAYPGFGGPSPQGWVGEGRHQPLNALS